MVNASDYWRPINLSYRIEFKKKGLNFYYLEVSEDYFYFFLQFVRFIMLFTMFYSYLTFTMFYSL